MPKATIGARAQASKVPFAEEFEACALPDTANAALGPFADDERVSLNGSPLRLDPDCCEALVLALHELATDAHKYGALWVDSGKIYLSGQTSNMTVPSFVRPSLQDWEGYLPARQRGPHAVTLTYDPTGLACELIVPLAHS